jgi:hypothetical protein
VTKPDDITDVEDQLYQMIIEEISDMSEKDSKKYVPSEWTK